ncbi:MAG: DUF2058 domain-containing protein [Granulosicoccus sp.]
MAKSLQEQLRQAGLASQKQAVKARKAKNTKEKMQRKGVPLVDETSEAVRQKDAEKAARDRELNEQRNQAAQQRAIQAQIRQLVDLNVIAERGDEAYKFTHQGLIKTLMLSPDVRQSLINGSLAIVGKEDEQSIVPAKVAEKIRERDESWLVLLNQRDSDIDIDDEYADYAVPDDLMW